MTISAGNATVSVPTFQVGSEPHRRRIATWATIAQNRLDNHDDSISALEASVSAINTSVTNLNASVSAINTAVTNLQNSLSAAVVVVALAVSNTSAQTFTAGVTNRVVGYQVPDIDTHNAFNSSSGVYTVPISGIYEIDCAMLSQSTAWAAGQGIILRTYKNSATNVSSSLRRADAAVTAFLGTHTHALVSCTVGDILTVSVAMETLTNLYHANTADAVTFNRLSINKVK